MSISINIDKSVRSKYFHADNIAAALLILIAAAVFMPVFMSMDKITNNPDFLQLATRHRMFRENVLNHHQFPLRSAYIGGGYPTISDPEDPSLSPFVLLTLLFGEIIGLKMIAFIIFLTGLAGMYLFLRKSQEYDTFSTLYGVIAFGFSGWFVARFRGGNINELYYFLLPLVLFLHDKFIKEGKFLFLLSVLLSSIAMDGKFLFPVIIIFFLLYSVLNDIHWEEGKLRVEVRYLKKFLLMTLCVVLLSAVKLLPSAVLFLQKSSIFSPLVDTHVSEYENMLTHGWDIFITRFDFYVGYIPLLFFSLSL